ncbi:MAG: hypothetical protein ACPGVT_08275 [Maricaulaceae bacterium]
MTTTAHDLYMQIGLSIDGAESSQMFGKPCFKYSGKAFLCFFQDEMVFKLTGEPHAAALALSGAKLFDPSGKGRAMKEWVQIPESHSDQWEKFAEDALTYLKTVLAE